MRKLINQYIPKHSMIKINTLFSENCHQYCVDDENVSFQYKANLFDFFMHHISSYMGPAWALMR